MVLRPFIGKFVIVYFDDILVYSRHKASYMKHLSHVFQVLRQQKLYAKLEKCKLFTTQVRFLGYVVPNEGIQVDESKIKAIKSRFISTSITDIRSLHGLDTFRQRFIKNFSSIMDLNRIYEGRKF